MEDLYFIDTGYASYGIVVKNGTIVYAAPIASWSIGKDWEWFEHYAQAKKWIVQCTRKSQKDQL